MLVYVCWLATYFETKKLVATYINYFLAKGLSINDVIQFLNPLPSSLCCLLLRLQHWSHKIIDPLQPLNSDVIYGRPLNVSIMRQSIQSIYQCSLLTTVNRGLKLLFFYLQVTLKTDPVWLTNSTELQLMLSRRKKSPSNKITKFLEKMKKVWSDVNFTNML